MRSKPVQWLLAAALISTFAIPGWAQPELVGGEFKINQNAGARPVKPQVAFSPSGSYRIVWENDIVGLMTRTFDRDGKPTTAETVLIANNNLPGIPARGNVTVRKDPALAYLPGGDFLVFWTEEKDFLSLDYFYEQREILEQDVYGQRFTAQGTPAGERFRVNGAAADHQRRPRVALHPDGIVVVWEQAAKDVVGDSIAVYGRLLNRRGAAVGGDFRVDAGDAREIWHLAVAANAPGSFAVTWEADKSDDPDVKVRFFDRRGEALGAPIVANATTAGRQRRPDVLATRDGDFLVVWQSSLRSENVRSVMGQLYSRAGARIGKEIEMTKGKPEHIHAAPALALLPSGNIVVSWIDWAGILPDGIFAKLLDRDGAPIGADLLISQGRTYPQYLISVAANAHGDVVATWEALIQKEQAVAGRRLKAD
jgi:hypothetical protein